MYSNQERSSEELSALALTSSNTILSVAHHTQPDPDINIYSPRFITGGSPHPGVIVEPPGLANVEPPPLRYRPRLPKYLSETGKL